MNNKQPKCHEVYKTQSDKIKVSIKVYFNDL